jgi:NAD(P) transhydrogenase subunit alpha
MYSQMAAGSVIVDLAAESGGNVEGSQPGETITTPSGVVIWGGKDVPSQLPFHASSLYSRNVVNLLMLMTKSETTDGATRATVTPDFADEIIAAAALTHDGAIRERK